MTDRVTRRKFLALAAGATALGLGAQSSRLDSCENADLPRGCVLPEPAQAPFDTVVVLMMENRSFDHLLGWLPGANGRQEGLEYVDTNGDTRTTSALAPDFQGCLYGDPDHTWEGAETQYAEGRCDGFLKTADPGDVFPIGFYREQDLPILSALARGYTTFDAYFCSMLGPTWQNRLYQLTGTTQLTPDCDFPRPGEPRPVTIETTIFDRVREAGLTAGYYYHDEPMTGIFESRKYDDIAYPIDRFWMDAREGKLPNVVFVDPNYTDRAEDMGTSNDYHPWGHVLVAEGFVAQVHDALKSSPQWDRMVFVLNFDEHGGFFDHVPPPECQDDTVLTGSDRLPNLKRLGFRVPAIAMGPFAPPRIEKAGPYEHCSILKMIEWRWGLEPMTLRDRHAKNLAEALDFTHRRDTIDLPAFTAPPPTACAEGGGWTRLSVSAEGWISVPCEGPEDGVCSGRLVADGQIIAVASARGPGGTEPGVLWMKLTRSGFRLLRVAPSNRLNAVLEMSIAESDGTVCRSSSPAILMARSPSQLRAVADGFGPG
jgi:phospholipase C